MVVLGIVFTLWNYWWNKKIGLWPNGLVRYPCLTELINFIPISSGSFELILILGSCLRGPKFIGPLEIDFDIFLTII